MSANPAAFNWLRSQAYVFANEHGRDRDSLRRYCFEQIREWRRTDPEGEELSERAGDDLAYDVADWVAEKYRPKKKQPKSTRKERALDRATITFWTEEIEEAGERPSVRNVAAWAQYSKTKAGRLLVAEGIAPVRKATIAKLSTKAQQLYRVLDWNLRDPGEIALSVDGLIHQLWPRQPMVEQKKSARSMQKTRLKKLIDEIQSARLGFHIAMVDGVVAVRRGRRWKRLQEIAAYLDEQKQRKRIFVPFTPPEPVKKDLFWSQPEIQICVGLLRLSIQRDIYDVEIAMPLVNAMRFIADGEPIVRAINRATRSSDRSTDYLFKLADHVRKKNPAVGKAIAKFASIAQKLLLDGGSGWEAKYVLKDALEASEYLSRLDAHDKAAGNRIRYLLEAVIRYGDSSAKVVERCDKFAQNEKANLWRQGPADEKAVNRAIESIPF